LIYVLYASLILPLPLLVIAWSRSDSQPIELSILTLSTVLFLSALVRSLKLALLGTDYSSRLFTTIGINMLVAFILGVYLGVKRRWLAAVAAVILALGWLLMGAINSAV
jgi:hypothetical protein